MFFEDHIDDAKYCGHLYGLGASYVQNGTSGGNNSASNYESSHAPGNVMNGEALLVSTTSTTAN